MFPAKITVRAMNYFFETGAYATLQYRTMNPFVISMDNLSTFLSMGACCALEINIQPYINIWTGHINWSSFSRGLEGSGYKTVNRRKGYLSRSLLQGPRDPGPRDWYQMKRQWVLNQKGESMHNVCISDTPQAEATDKRKRTLSKHQIIDQSTAQRLKWLFMDSYRNHAKSHAGTRDHQGWFCDLSLRIRLATRGWRPSSTPSILYMHKIRSTIWLRIVACLRFKCRKCSR